MTYTVTIASGKKDVVLPDGNRYQAGDTATLSDAQYAMLSPGAKSTLISATSDAGLTAATLLAMPSASYGPAEAHTFDTSSARAIALDMTITSLTGGTSPAITLFVERQGADGNWYAVTSSSGVTFSSGFPQSVSIDLGEFSLTASGPFNSAAQHNVATMTGRIRWTTTGSPTAVVLSASVIGR